VHVHHRLVGYACLLGLDYDTQGVAGQALLTIVSQNVEVFGIVMSVCVCVCVCVCICVSVCARVRVGLSPCVCIWFVSVSILP
jgi:hypothetical protein